MSTYVNFSKSVLIKQKEIYESVDWNLPINDYISGLQNNDSSRLNRSYKTANKMNKSIIASLSGLTLDVKDGIDEVNNEESELSKRNRNKIDKLYKESDVAYINSLKKGKDTANLNNLPLLHKGRHYNFNTLSQLLTDSAFKSANTVTAIGTAQKYGTDLVQISAHNTVTDICTHYEGKVFSISGETKGYPFLDRTVPFHFNCKHLTFPYFENAESESDAEQMKEFSQAGTEFKNGRRVVNFDPKNPRRSRTGKTPPYPNTFVPLDKRPKISLKQERVLQKEIKDLEKKKDKSQYDLDRLANKKQKLKTDGGWDKFIGVAPTPTVVTVKGSNK